MAAYTAVSDPGPKKDQIAAAANANRENYPVILQDAKDTLAWLGQLRDAANTRAAYYRESPAQIRQDLGDSIYRWRDFYKQEREYSVLKQFIERKEQDPYHTSPTDQEILVFAAAMELFVKRNTGMRAKGAGFPLDLEESAAKAARRARDEEGFISNKYRLRAIEIVCNEAEYFWNQQFIGLDKLIHDVELLHKKTAPILASGKDDGKIARLADLLAEGQALAEADKAKQPSKVDWSMKFSTLQTNLPEIREAAQRGFVWIALGEAWLFGKKEALKEATNSDYTSYFFKDHLSSILTECTPSTGFPNSHSFMDSSQNPFYAEKAELYSVSQGKRNEELATLGKKNATPEYAKFVEDLVKGALSFPEVHDRQHPFWGQVARNYRQPILAETPEPVAVVEQIPEEHNDKHKKKRVGGFLGGLLGGGRKRG